MINPMRLFPHLSLPNITQNYPASSITNGTKVLNEGVGLSYYTSQVVRSHIEKNIGGIGLTMTVTNEEQ